MTLPAPFAQNGNPDQRALISHCLRYTITPAALSSAATKPLSGIISVGAARQQNLGLEFFSLASHLKIDHAAFRIELSGAIFCCK
jgi:hypothetical protein